jgi:ureidoglycolate lyase
LPVDARQLSRRPRDAAVHDDRVEGVVWRMWSVQREAQLVQSLIGTIHRVPDSKSYVVKAEPLTAEAFAPFGQLVKEGDMVMELRDGEEFHLNVLHYDRAELRCDHLNRHHKATQALVALAGKPTLLVVAPKEYDFSTEDHLPHVRAFICDGSAGVNLALGTWHWGPYPILDYVDLVNVQGKGFANDNEVAYLERDLDVVVDVIL